MNVQTLDSEEIISAYRAAVEHANGAAFASILRVSYADGWFTVRDLDGAESRYRKKEIVSETQKLLKQPEFQSHSVSDLAAEASAARAHEPPRVKPPRKVPQIAPLAEAASRQEELLQNAVMTNDPIPVLNAPRPAGHPQNEKVIDFPAPAPAPEMPRAVEDKAYRRNLLRIFAVVGLAFGILVIFLLLRGR